MIKLTVMHRMTTNNAAQALDAYNNTFESPGVLASLTNTQSMPT